jgi:hypothetical protein
LFRINQPLAGSVATSSKFSLYDCARAGAPAPANKKNKTAVKTGARFKKLKPDDTIWLTEFIKIAFRKGLRAKNPSADKKTCGKLAEAPDFTRQDSVCNLLALFLKVKKFSQVIN